MALQTEIKEGVFVWLNGEIDDISFDKLYRVESVQTNHLTLDNKFTKGLTHSQHPTGYFEVVPVDNCKEYFKEIALKYRPDAKKITLDEDNTKGIFINLKADGDVLWDHEKGWMVTEETPSTESEAVSLSSSEEITIDIQTQEQATHVASFYNKKHFEKYFVKKYKEIVFYIRNSKLARYGDKANAIENGKEITSYEDWWEMVSGEKTPKTNTMVKGSIEEQIITTAKNYIESDKGKDTMKDSVESILNGWGVDKTVRELTVKVSRKKPKKVGKVHFRFDLVLKCMMARTNLALVGPAGSGKTTTVAKAAKALDLEFYSKSVSAQTGAHEFFGYQDANGNYVRTLFREAYENGGVFLLDEFDAGNPNVLAALNQSTANESCAFADGMVPKHKDFICVMAGNTYGHGANSEYVGRNKIDAATLDRFAFIDFPYDKDLEYALANNKAWCKKVQSYREKVNKKKIRTIISPRATIIGCQLLANGIEEKDVMELLIFKGLNEAERKLLS